MVSFNRLDVKTYQCIIVSSFPTFLGSWTKSSEDTTS